MDIYEALAANRHPVHEVSSRNRWNTRSVSKCRNRFGRRTTRRAAWVGF